MKLKISCLIVAFAFLPGSLVGCSLQDLSVGNAVGAATDAYKAATLSDEEVAKMARGFATESDSQNRVASQGSKYGARLAKLTKNYRREDGMTLDYKVYLSDEVNAFALANGSVRVYSGLMDMMSDQELLFVIGHEVGHVKLGHSRAAIQTAYATSAARKGVAARANTAGQIAASGLGALLEQVINAQFSQSQEEEADDYGLNFMKRHKLDRKASVSALKKLAKLGDDSSLLSSHPAPSERAERIADQL